MHESTNLTSRQRSVQVADPGPPNDKLSMHCKQSSSLTEPVFALALPAGHKLHETAPPTAP
jgi:hypothetical protein